LGVFQSLKLRILMEKNPFISLELNFTSNTLGCYGLVGEFNDSNSEKSKLIFEKAQNQIQ